VYSPAIAVSASVRLIAADTVTTGAAGAPCSASKLVRTAASSVIRTLQA
jgi:hypothetical protein